MDEKKRINKIFVIMFNAESHGVMAFQHNFTICFNFLHVLNVSIKRLVSSLDKSKKLICHYWNWSGTNQIQKPMCTMQYGHYTASKYTTCRFNQTAIILSSVSQNCVRLASKIKSGTNHICSARIDRAVKHTRMFRFSSSCCLLFAYKKNQMVSGFLLFAAAQCMSFATTTTHTGPIDFLSHIRTLTLIVIFFSDKHLSKTL